MGKEVFNCMLSLPPMLYVLCLFTRPDKLNGPFFLCWCATESSFPAGLPQCLLSLLVCTYLGSSFPEGLYKFPSLKFCFDIQTKWLMVIKCINWVDIHKIILTAKYGQKVIIIAHPVHSSGEQKMTVT